MRNFSTVYLLSQERHGFEFASMTRQKSDDGGYSDTIFYIPIDAKMDGL